MGKMFPVIDLAATGENITQLRKSRGLTVRDLQDWFGFEEPQAIYKWQKGKSLPTVDNLYALGVLLDVPIEEILVPCKPKLNMVKNGQQEVSCCPPLLCGYCEYDRIVDPCNHFGPQCLLPAELSQESPRKKVMGAVPEGVRFIKINIQYLEMSAGMVG